ncbi:MAG: glycosyltransferase family 4 protein [Limnohabitans sp.]|nr:glycosyltransferase family 4 protein [Limnohabitans sp.]
MTTPKIIYLVTVDWFFCSHFLERAVAARAAGYEVLVVTHIQHERERLEQLGLRVTALDMGRRSVNPLAALVTLWRLTALYRAERPSIVHHIALKPILIGSLAARLAGIRGVVNAVIGMGFAYTSRHVLARTLRPVMTMILRLLLNPPGSHVVFENHDDLETSVALGTVKRHDAVLIRGAGVQPQTHNIDRAPHDIPVVVLVARMLWDKGIQEYVTAAQLLRQQGVKVRCLLVGGVDQDNRASIDEATLQRWNAEGVVEWLGFRTDVAQLLTQADIACLPSYREGLPKALLEAMAAGLPCVTTDVPGCREAVRHGDNGLLVPARHPEALAQALKQLIEDPAMRARMGARGRERVQQEFSSQQVIAQTLALYQTVVAS